MGSKKKALLDIRNDDRISDLPDDLLTHILSFIPTIYSVRTRVLSKRWKQLFTLVPVLDFTLYHHECDEDCYPDCDCDCGCDFNCGCVFDCGCDYDCDISKSFIEFVSWVFNSYHVDKMDRFRYSACVPPGLWSPLQSWISESLRRGVRELDVSYMSCHPQKLPHGVFTCKTLTVLKIEGDFKVEVPDDVCLPLVKTIHLLREKRVDVCTASRLFQSCPVLEDLYICLELKDNQVLNISIPTLKNLKLRVRGRFELVLDVPNVECVELDGDLAIKFSAVQGSKLLNRASINLYYLSDDGFFEVIEMLAFQTRGRSPPTFQNLVHLEIGVFLSSSFPELLLKFLDRTPHLEVLVVNNDWDEEDVINQQGGLLPEYVPSCVSLHLKKVEYNGSLLDYQCQLVEYLLKNGKVLEMVKIQSADLPGKYLQFNEKLQNYPKYSKGCKVELKLI